MYNHIWLIILSALYDYNFEPAFHSCDLAWSLYSHLLPLLARLHTFDTPFLVTPTFILV